MKLAVDSNILFSFFRKGSQTRKIIATIESFELCTLKSRIDELIEHRDEICAKARIGPEDFMKTLSEIEVFVEVIDDSLAFDMAREARKIAPHEEDAPLFALALKLGCGIWSNEKAFKRQTKVKVLDTTEMTEILES